MCYTFGKCLFLLTLILVVGCTTERYISPTLSGPVRNIDLKQPILGAVLDGRSAQSSDSSAVLQRDLAKLYGSSIKWGDYFEQVPDGRVGIRIRIVTLGATFGSRLISSASYASAIASAKGHAIGPWGAVVANSSSEASAVGGTFTGEGWWNGASWIDVEVQDRRFGNNVTFVLPIAAESYQANLWGYASGDQAAKIAWNRTSEQLTRVLDMILRTVRDED